MVNLLRCKKKSTTLKAPFQMSKNEVKKMRINFPASDSLVEASTA